MKPGDVGLVSIKGEVGKAIRLGQWINGDGWLPFEHAMICTSVLGGTGETEVIQAQPGGAGYALYYPEDKVTWLTVPGIRLSQRVRIVNAACGSLGTPYSFLDYVAIALHRFGVPAPGLRRYISSTGHMICSQLVDFYYQMAGIQLFRDGRWPGYVTPADLWNLRARGELVDA